jgi:hypothetical protein
VRRRGITEKIETAIVMGTMFETLLRVFEKPEPISRDPEINAVVILERLRKLKVDCIQKGIV